MDIGQSMDRLMLQSRSECQPDERVTHTYLCLLMASRSYGSHEKLGSGSKFWLLTSINLFLFKILRGQKIKQRQ